MKLLRQVDTTLFFETQCIYFISHRVQQTRDIENEITQNAMYTHRERHATSTIKLY